MDKQKRKAPPSKSRYRHRLFFRVMKCLIALQIISICAFQMHTLEIFYPFLESLEDATMYGFPLIPILTVAGLFTALKKHHSENRHTAIHALYPLMLFICFQFVLSFIVIINNNRAPFQDRITINEQVYYIQRGWNLVPPSYDDYWTHIYQCDDLELRCFLKEQFARPLSSFSVDEGKIILKFRKYKSGTEIIVIRPD